MTEDNIVDVKDAEPTLEDVTEQEETEEVEPTYTQSELDSRISKAVESATAKRESKLQAEVEERIEKERNEAVEYARLTQSEKDKADYEKREKALKDREQAINNRELRGQIEADLKENELPASLADSLLTLQDNEKIKESIAGIKKEFDDAINQRVKESLRQDSPTASSREVETDEFAKRLKKYQ